MPPVENTKDSRQGVQTLFAASRAAWRDWLHQNHAREKSIWLIIYHKSSSTESVSYEEAVEEALCFGWIDSKPNKRDKESYFQYFSRRKPVSRWSWKNKQTIEKLIAAGLMQEAGFRAVQIARENNSWSALDAVEKMLIPEDLQAAFDQYAHAAANFDHFPKSVKKGILEWVMSARKPETRDKRIQETAAEASQNRRANQYRQK